MKKLFISLAIILVFPLSFMAQEAESSVELDLGTDIVSSYVWRGLSFSSGLNLQPWLNLSAGGFSVGAWGSFSTTGDFLEPDFYLSYAAGSFAATLTDFHGNSGADFFNYKSDETSHVGELMLQYKGTETFPLTATASALVYGDDKKILEYIDGEPVLGEDNNYSMYFELAYTHATKNDITLDFFAGCVANESYFYGTDGFALINLGLKASKEIKITDNFSLPINFSLITNPDSKNVFYVIGIKL